MSANNFFALALGYCKGISFAKMFVDPHCMEKASTLLVRAQDTSQLFSIDFRHWHRFSVVALFSAYLSDFSGMTTSLSKGCKDKCQD